MAAILDEYMDAPLDTDDVFPCKGCGEILEEGKAFELAGNRWHLDCFRCATCTTLLDSDANLLLLGDGSLICNNCTYTCSICANKIEDLAILTGDQAFCSTCFRCRNCKRKIENLKYARTSQGIFCMGCHETIMARRSKKKSKAAAAAAAAAKTQPKESSPMLKDKSLPALPPTISTSTTEGRAELDSDTPTELSPRPRNANRPTADSSSRGSSRPALSPERGDEYAGNPDGLTLPATTYRRNRNSAIIGGTDVNTGDSSDGRRLTSSHNPNGGTPSSAVEGRKDGDYFGNGNPKRGGGSRGGTPHIAFQDRSTSSDQVPQTRPKRSQSKTEKDNNRESADGEEFKLQEAPRSKKGLSSRSDGSQASSPQDGSAGKDTNGLPYRERSAARASRDEEDSGTSPEAGSKSGPTKQIARKELPSSAARPIPGRSGDGPYTQPRSAPAPPRSRSSTVNKDDESGSPKPSPKLPRWSSGGDFSMDEDMARILGTDEGSSSIMRRVSNAVRHGRTNSVESVTQHHHSHRASHGRSISETTRSLVSPRWPKSPLSDEGNDMASPLATKAKEDAVILKRQLRNSEQRVAELERQFNTEKDLQNLNKKLVEKRKTVSALDSQTEIMIKQLETLAGYVERAKETKAPIDPRDLEDSTVKEFVQKLEQVKEQMASEIEELHEQRDRIVEDRDKAMADRDRALMEFEQLSSKNAQLADMNNDLTHQIQERFKSQVGDVRSPNGLGIYGNMKGNGSNLNLDAASMTTGATLVPGDDDAIVESGPTVVQVRKGQVKKFNWKKGSKTMAQNVAKGVNRAVVAFQQNERPQIQHQGLSGDSIGIPYNMTQTQTDSVVSTPGALGVNGAANRNQLEPGRQGFGFFGKKNAMPKSVSANTFMTPTATEPPSVLFGSELTERADFEHRQIPSVVTRCIEEVELRGMDQEGIYRKTGGNSQVNNIKDGFDKDENFDISDPDLDITAVTSVLKQYFRKLPTPLLTFEVYERVLESNAVVDETERCTHLRKTFAALPQSHRDCLEFLMFHLRRVAERESENLMSPKNLAVVFAPTIMRDESIEREMTDMHAKNIAVQFVIENSHVIFEEA